MGATVRALGACLWFAVVSVTLSAAGAAQGSVASNQSDASVAPQNGGTAQAVDGIAARIEDDIITESEVRELAAFQLLVDGKSKPRAELIRELVDQWATRGEADAEKFPVPSAADVNNAYAQLAMQFGGAKNFDSRAAAVELNEAAVRRLLGQQLYLSRFLDYRFRPAVQVDDAEIEAYYRDEFAPQVKERGQPVPSIENVQETIREVLVQRAITQRANEWLDNTRGHLQVEPIHEGDAR